MTTSSAPSHSDLRSTIDLKQLDAVLPSLAAADKAAVLRALARRAAEISGRAEEEIQATLSLRERLGSTGIGNGIAIPHGKLPNLDRIYSIFARLEKPVAFESIDNQPVDLVYMVLGPVGADGNHLTMLSQITRILRDPATREKLRAANDEAEIQNLLR